jgi:hypothetical protein
MTSLSEFVSAFDSAAMENMERMGDIIYHQSLNESAPDLSWDSAMPGPGWSILDQETTVSKLFPFLQTTIAKLQGGLDDER